MRKMPRGVSIWEWLIVVLLLMVFASVLFPIFAKAREGARKPTCTGNVKQLATAAVMYAQDNNQQFPGIDGSSWVSKIAPYVGNEKKLFWCQSDPPKKKNKVSYAYSGLLLRPDGTGVRDSAIVSVSEVGVLADTAPPAEFPNGYVIGGCALNASVQSVMPALRHSKGCVVGFADGHAKYYASNNGWNSSDISNGAVRALYAASSLGLINNPVGMLQDFTPAGVNPAKIVVGGDCALAPLLIAAADAWTVKAKAPFACSGFVGEYTVPPSGANYAWGVGDGKAPVKGNYVAVASDAVIVVVSRETKLFSFSTRINGCYVKTAAEINTLFANGYTTNSAQVYALDQNNGTRKFLLTKLGNTRKMPFGKGTIFFKTDDDVVYAVANDPYGIGFISSTFFDPDRLIEVALKTPDGKLHCYPTADEKHRWDMAYRDNNHPFARTLYVAFGGQTWTPGKPCFGSEMLAPGSPGMTALQAGPLYTWGYGKP